MINVNSISNVIRQYKSRVSKTIHDTIREDFSWQRGYYDSIIRNEDHLWRVKQYIINNPKNWLKDPEND